MTKERGKSNGKIMIGLVSDCLIEEKKSKYITKQISSF